MELGGVLSRPVFATWLALLERAAHEVLGDYSDAVELVTPHAVPHVVEADPDDDQVVAAAVAANADLIVSGDRHLLRLGSHGDVAVITADECIRRIGGGSSS